MVELVHVEDSWASGSWRSWKQPIFPGPVLRDTVAITCLGCGKAMCLPNHTVAADGAVQPSVVCPFACGWHVFLKLLS